METVYTTVRYATKKLLRDEVKNGIYPACHCEGLGPRDVPDGKHVIVGPGPYERRWYGQVQVKNGCIVRVAS